MKRLTDSQLLNLLNKKALRFSDRQDEEAFISFLRGLLAKHGSAWIRSNNSKILDQWQVWRQEFLQTDREQYIDKILKNPKRNARKEDFSIITKSVILGIVMLVLMVVIVKVMDRPRISSCSYNETNAQNTLAALASYFSEPDKDEVPTVEDLMASEGLTLNPHSTVIIDSSADRVRVTVIDETGDCPRGKKFEVYMNGTAGNWFSE